MTQTCLKLKMYLEYVLQSTQKYIYLRVNPKRLTRRLDRLILDSVFVCDRAILRRAYHDGWAYKIVHPRRVLFSKALGIDKQLASRWRRSRIEHVCTCMARNVHKDIGVFRYENDRCASRIRIFIARHSNRYYIKCFLRLSVGGEYLRWASSTIWKVCESSITMQYMYIIERYIHTVGEKEFDVERVLSKIRRQFLSLFLN